MSIGEPSAMSSFTPESIWAGLVALHDSLLAQSSVIQTHDHIIKVLLLQHKVILLMVATFKVDTAGMATTDDTKVVSLQHNVRSAEQHLS